MGGVIVALTVAAVVVVVVDDEDDPPAAATTTSTALVGTPGATGVGDPYFPGLGNGGYDVEHYRLSLDWDGDGRLGGVATITATATQDLSSFSLDLAGLDVATVSVEGRETSHRRDGHELVITPGEPIASGSAFVTSVAYGGEPRPLDEATALYDAGWQTDGREAFVVGEPGGARTFFPANDHPGDKATFTIEVEAPADLVVAANGRLVGDPGFADGGGARVWTYEMSAPMATYLVQVAIGDLELVEAGEVDGVRLRHALHRSFVAAATDTVERTADMLLLLAEVWGPYPFAEYGVVAVDEPLGFALETQTLTLIGSDTARSGLGADLLLVHELAHQWVGNAVSPATWKDIWLNEGMATYSEWLWMERTGVAPAAEIARDETSRRLDRPAGDPGTDELFHETVYVRGALTMQALREAVGDEAFFRILREWVVRHSGGTASTADLVALSEEVSGQPLDELFGAWLYGARVPELG